MDKTQTRIEIEQAYHALSAKVGDLYLVITGKEAELAALKKQMAEYHKEHAALSKAFQEAQGESQKAPDAPSA